MDASHEIPIERLTTADEEAGRVVERLFPQLTTDPVPDLDALARILDAGAVILVARSEGTIVGMATMVVVTVLSGSTGQVEDVVVDAGFRGRGIGERLIRELMVEARARGADAMALTSHPSRVEANRLYQRLGFELGATNFYSLDL